MPVTSYTIPAAPPAATVVQGGTDGDLIEITNLCEESLTLLLAQYQDSPRLKSLICSFIERLQELETATIAVHTNVLNIELAAGDNLDLLGKVIGESRDGRTDALYRNALRVRVLINISDGKIEQLIDIVRLYEQMDLVPGSRVEIKEIQPARLEVRVITTPVNPPQEVDKRLRQAKAGGVALTTMLHYGGVGGSFTFNRAADYPEKNTTQGFEGIAGPVAGGSFTHAVGS